MSQAAPTIRFGDLSLPPALLAVLDDVGYETPSPVQALTIPELLKGRDVLGHAPTGTGKTAAFALPLLARLDLSLAQVQVMVLAPTRELAIQVAEAFNTYAGRLKGFHVLPIYGGQSYGAQISALKRGVHVVVGTPGRVMDHIRRGTLKLDKLAALVLDEADEMLRMGFHEDVEWILEKLPEQRQIALFSATMPKAIQKIARNYLDAPAEISIKSATATAETIRQRYWQVSRLHKLDALTRILEVESFDAILMFVRTKVATVELAEKLAARGYGTAALNSDLPQNQRERIVERLKKGTLDILVATDVAARGLDVERISHVVNYDIPYDTEAYIHRIGRTGRAGRQGDAILFVAPREKPMLAAIERATRQKIEPLTLPTTEMVNNKRIANFKQCITDMLSAGELDFMRGLVEQYQQEHDVPGIEIAAALAKMHIGDRSLLLQEKPERKPKAERSDRDWSSPSGRRPGQSRRKDNKRSGGKRKSNPVPEGMEKFRIEVGHDHDVQPGNIVGAIANEAGLDGANVGHIDIHATHSLVNLPLGMPADIFKSLKKAWVCGQQLQISRFDAGAGFASSPRKSRKSISQKDFGDASRKRTKKHPSADKSHKKPGKPRRRHGT